MFKSFESGEQVKVAKRQVIDTTGKVFYINSGYVGVYIGTGKHRQMLVMMKEGNTFPLALTSDVPLWQSEVYYKTMSDTVLHELSRQDYLRTRDKMGKKELEQELFVKTRGNSTLMERVVNLMTNDISRKLYMRLIYLADFLDAIRGDTAVLNMPLTYVDLAESIGTTRETVNRLITSLQNEGILSVNKRIITINSLSRLEELFKATSSF